MEFFTTTLQNGIRIIHCQQESPVAHCGFFVQTGSRDEMPGEEGMAHFAEHIFFKHTHKRNTYQILSRMEDVGGDLNAYTTKEETCIEASFMQPHYERALELMADLVFNRHFLDKDIEKEKDVVIDEINSYRDTPSENIFDEFDQLVFGSHPLAHPILGTSRNVRQFSAARMEQFVTDRYFTDRMVIASVGDIRTSRLLKWCDKHFGSAPARPCTGLFRPELHYSPVRKEVQKRIHQGHCCMGTLGYSYFHPKRDTLTLLCNLLGGPGMNTRLNMALREHNGWSYTAEAAFTPYSDTGVASIYFSTEKANLNHCIETVERELQKVRSTRLGTMQLHRAQHQLIGQLAISSDSRENLMLSVGKSHLVFNHVDTLEETCRSIRSITASDLMEVANEIWAGDRMSMLTYK